MDLEALDPVYVDGVLSQAPFVSLDGTFNVRDIHHSHDIKPFKPCKCSGSVKPSFIFRSGELSALTEHGSQQLRALGVKTVFDLRSEPEMHKYGSTRVPVVEGVEFVRVPVFKDVDYSPENMVKRYKLYASGRDEAFMQLYSEILESAGPAYSAILLHIRNRPLDAILFHCTAGKDRTGILAALLLRLAGADDACIAQDYSLTRVGREPAREQVMERLKREPMFAADNQQMQNMFQCRAETMSAFLRVLDEKYGGAEQYLMTYCGLSHEDLAVVRKNISER